MGLHSARHGFLFSLIEHKWVTLWVICWQHFGYRIANLCARGALLFQQKDVSVYPLRHVQDISASITLAPIQPINVTLPNKVHWLARSRRRLRQLRGQRSCGEMSNGGSIRSHRNGRHLLHTVGQGKWKSAPDSEPRQLAYKTLQSDVKVIYSDNEMNRIKTTEWCNQNGISFEPCAPDIHAQNGVAERFRKSIVEKARAMHLSANLPHKLRRKIVSTATYL